MSMGWTGCGVPGLEPALRPRVGQEVRHPSIGEASLQIAGVAQGALATRALFEAEIAKLMVGETGQMDEHAAT
jgi:hypothetical protein